MSGAAAAANRIRDRREKELKSLHDAQQAVIDKWFADNDANGDGLLGRDEMKLLLASVTDKQPCEGALDMAMRYGTDNQITRAIAPEVVAKVTEYIKSQESIEPIFQKMDTDTSGGVDGNELLPLLKMVAAMSGFKGFEEKITVKDVEMVMKVCDTDSSGAIERSEIVHACVAWKDMLANDDAPCLKYMVGSDLVKAGVNSSTKKSSACSIL